MTLYVDQSSSCSDSGPGSQAEPFCSIQAAANVVVAGQTVDIEGGDAGGVGAEYREAVVITHSGTSAAPITFAGVRSPGGLSPYLYPASDAPISLDGVHDVSISDLALDPYGNADGVDVVGSQQVTLDDVSVSPQGAATASPSGIAIDGGSSGVTISRSQVFESPGFGIRSESGAQQITITTNYVEGGISLRGTSGAEVTSNSVAGAAAAHSRQEAAPRRWWRTITSV